MGDLGLVEAYKVYCVPSQLVRIYASYFHLFFIQTVAPANGFIFINYKEGRNNQKSQVYKNVE